MGLDSCVRSQALAPMDFEPILKKPRLNLGFPNAKQRKTLPSAVEIGVILTVVPAILQCRNVQGVNANV